MGNVKRALDFDWLSFSFSFVFQTDDFSIGERGKANALLVLSCAGPTAHRSLAQPNGLGTRRQPIPAPQQGPNRARYTGRISCSIAALQAAGPFPHPYPGPWPGLRDLTRRWR